MTEEELLKQAENFADDMYKESAPEWASAKAHQSMALSLLVIARNSIPTKENKPVDLNVDLRSMVDNMPGNT